MIQDLEEEARTFTRMAHEAMTAALVALLESMPPRAAMTDARARSLEAAFRVRKRAEMERLFRDLEDVNPGMAARLYEQYKEPGASTEDPR